MADTPAGIKILSDAKTVEVAWNGGGVTRFPFRWLRGHCPCAVCVSENTGQRLVGTDDVAADVRPVGASFVGNYALKIQWSDGHDTGLYSWEWLGELRHGVEGGASE